MRIQFASMIFQNNLPTVLSTGRILIDLFILDTIESRFLLPLGLTKLTGMG
jgi:hypothetical protein